MAVRVTQSTTESSLQSGAGKVRFTQGTIESSFASGVGKVRFTQGTAEVSIQSGIGQPRLTQIAVEVSVPHNVLRQLDVKKPITAWINEPEANFPPHTGFQNQALLLAPPVYAPGVVVPLRIVTARPVVEEEQANRPWIGRLPGLRRRGPRAWVIT